MLDKAMNSPDMAYAPSSSSDDGSIDASTVPTTPEWSPYLTALQSDSSVRIQNLSRTRVPFTALGLGPAALPVTHEDVAAIRNVCVIGAGYVGGPTAAVLALHNPSVTVTVLDREASRIASWKSKHLPIHEPGLDMVVRLARDGGTRQNSNDEIDDEGTRTAYRASNLFFSTDSVACISHADIIFLAVNTPTKSSGRGAGAASDLSALESAVRNIAKYARNGAIVVEKSTVPCGTAKLINNILTSSRPDECFPVLSNPEFLAEGSAIKNLQCPDRVLIGSGPSLIGKMSAKRLGMLYSSWVPEDRILFTNVWSSELAKLVANAMLAQRVSSINSISALCERTGADIREISRSIGTDLRIGSKFLQSGLGFGGSCFRKDIASLVYISESLDLPEVAAYWHSVLTMNTFQRDRFTDKIVSRLNNTLIGKKVALLGFGYKKDTGDTRESLAVDVVASLLDEHPQEIAIFDPCCPETGIKAELKHLEGFSKRVKIYNNPYEACQNATAVAILTEWDFFKADRSRKLPRQFEGHSMDSGMPFSNGNEPLTMFLPLEPPPCPPNCQSCSSGQIQALLDAEERLDWNRVAKSLSSPRYVLDGRGILDERLMKLAGLEVDGLGWGPSMLHS